MKKIFTFLFSLLLAMVATDAAAQLHFGFGYTRTIDSFNYPVLNNAKAETSLNGVYAGIGVTIPVTQMLGITPGVYYSYNTDIDKDDIYGTSKVNSFTSEHYVKGVLDLSLKLPFTNDLALWYSPAPVTHTASRRRRRMTPTSAESTKSPSTSMIQICGMHMQGEISWWVPAPAWSS